MEKVSITALNSSTGTPAISLRAARALVVENQRHLSKFLPYVLECAGYEVCVAFDGEQALAAVESLPPDALLLDPGLPDISGLEWLRRLRTDRRIQTFIVLMLSASSSAHLCLKAQKAGANSCCTKPIAPASLLEKLAELSALARRE